MKDYFYNFTADRVSKFGGGVGALKKLVHDPKARMIVLYEIKN